MESTIVFILVVIFIAFVTDKKLREERSTMKNSESVFLGLTRFAWVLIGVILFWIAFFTWLSGGME